MNEHTRTPGRIDVETTPVGESASTHGSGYPGNEDITRKSGPVDGPTVAIPDDHIGTHSLEIVSPELIKRSPWTYVFWLFSVGLFIWLFYSVISAINTAWQQSIYLGFPLAALACIFLVVLGWAGQREYVALNAIDSLEERRTQMRLALESNNLTQLRDALGPTLKNLRQSHSGRIAEFEEAAKNRETASEYLEQFENLVLIHLDKEANAVINRTALGGGAVVAIIPHPALDAAVALWRATVLIRKIGEIYGLEPTGLSSLRLLKHSIATAVIAAGTSIAVDLTLEQVGKEVFSQVTASIGKRGVEGVVTAGRLYLLGNYAKRLCRPMTN